MDAEFARRLRRLAMGTFFRAEGRASISPGLPNDADESWSPSEVSAWWAALTDEERQACIERDPLKYGNLDGIDMASRDKANRIYLDDATKREQKKLERLKQRYGAHPSRRERQELELVQERVTALENISKTLEMESPEPKGDGTQRQLLSLDTSGKHVTAAVARGNVDTADHIGVLVPGLYTNVATNLAKYDGDAGVMAEAAERYARGESVAMVSYLGYEAPQDLAEAWRHAADDGAQ